MPTKSPRTLVRESHQNLSSHSHLTFATIMLTSSTLSTLLAHQGFRGLMHLRPFWEFLPNLCKFCFGIYILIGDFELEIGTHRVQRSPAQKGEGIRVCGRIVGTFNSTNGFWSLDWIGNCLVLVAIRRGVVVSNPKNKEAKILTSLGLNLGSIPRFSCTSM